MLVRTLEIAIMVTMATFKVRFGSFRVVGIMDKENKSLNAV